MYLRKTILIVSILSLLFSLKAFAQKEMEKDKKPVISYTGIWFASSYKVNDKELSSILSPSIEFLKNGTFIYSSTTANFTGRWKQSGNNRLVLTQNRKKGSKKLMWLLNVNPNELQLSGTFEENSKSPQKISASFGKAGGSSCPGVPTVVYMGKTYHTVQIGSQCWLQENIDAGTMIKGDQDQKDNGKIEKYCFEDNPDNCIRYGGLYQWDEAMQYSKADHTQGICPSGWHIMTKADYETLVSTVKKDGNSLKAQGQSAGATAGTNTTGFSGLFAGYRKSHGGFSEQGTHTYYWSTAITDSGTYYNMHLGEDTCTADLYDYTPKDGFSVRCVRD